MAQGKLEKDPDLLMDQMRAIDNKWLIQGPLLKCDEKLSQESMNVSTRLFQSK